MTTGSGTRADPWVLQTPPGSSEYTMYIDDAGDPPALAAQNSGKNIGDRIQIGRDAQPPPVQIVAGVNHTRDLFLWQDLGQSPDQLGSACAASKYGDHGAFLA